MDLIVTDMSITKDDLINKLMKHICNILIDKHTICFEWIQKYKQNIINNNNFFTFYAQFQTDIKSINKLDYRNSNFPCIIFEINVNDNSIVNFNNNIIVWRKKREKINHGLCLTVINFMKYMMNNRNNTRQFSCKYT